MESMARVRTSFGRFPEALCASPSAHRDNRGSTSDLCEVRLSYSSAKQVAEATRTLLANMVEREYQIPSEFAVLTAPHIRLCAALLDERTHFNTRSNARTRTPHRLILHLRTRILSHTCVPFTHSGARLFPWFRHDSHCPSLSFIVLHCPRLSFVSVSSRASRARTSSCEFEFSAAARRRFSDASGALLPQGVGAAQAAATHGGERQA
eukprot:6191013-Pleurochrysis_carterae.AAC.2